VRIIDSVEDIILIAVNKRYREHMFHLKLMSFLKMFLIIISLVFGVAVFGFSAISIGLTEQNNLSIIITVLSVLSFSSGILPKLIDIEAHITVRSILFSEYNILLGYKTSI
jgi:hypothetical protein